MTSISLARTCAAIASACALGAQAAPAYHLVDLGPNSIAHGVNAHGVVAGQLEPERAAIWRDGAWHTKGTGKDVDDINDGGDAVGWGQDANGQYHAYEWPHGASIVELAAPSALTGATAAVVSNEGVVGGFAYDASGLGRCVRWVDGVGEELAVEGANCYVSGVNRHGAIAGSTWSPSSQAFIWQDGVVQMLGTGPGTMSMSAKLNDKGHLAGSLQMPFKNHMRPTHAALWNGRKWIDLGTMDGTGSSYAYGINNADDIVGTVDSAATGTSHGFLYTGGTMYDLVDLVDNGAGWTFDGPADINDDGVIVGSSRLAADGLYHGFMLVPLTR